MKNKLIFLLLTGTLLMCSRVALAGAAGENYIGVQYASGDYTEDGISKSFAPGLMMARFGRFINSDFSIEARLGSGVRDDTQFLPEFGVSGLDARLELDAIFGAYARGHVNLTESASLYALLGASRVKGIADVPSFPGVTASDNKSGFSYGVGADIGLFDNVALNIEYMQYLKKSDYDLGAIALGVVVSF
jgi:outer membrane immunogenic protein